MVIDASAILAILLAETEAAQFVRAIDGDSVRLMPAVSYLEVSFVIVSRKGELGLNALESLVQRARIEIVSLTKEHVLAARSAWIRFGKGRHPAGLNLGDCCSYALAEISGEPLLFKGSDFSRTDVIAADY